PAPGSGGARGGGCVTSAGRPMREGQRWQEDACTTCECRGGARRCEAFMCQVACARPRHDPRECCPVCDVWPAHCPEMTCSHQCPFGFEAGDDGCSTCRCKQEPKECTLECPKGFLLDRLGQPLCRCAQPSSSSSTTTTTTTTAMTMTMTPSPACPPLVGCHKNCSHGFRLSRQGCPVCRCNQCRPMQPPDCERSCPHGFRVNDRGCPICKCKASPDLPSTHGSAVSFTLCKSSGLALRCRCSVSPPHRRCLPNDGDLGVAYPLFVSLALRVTAGRVRVLDGEVREDGESWFDGCRQCYCHGGTEMCALISCPALSCAAPVFNATGACCPHCRDEAPLAWRGAPAGMVCLGADGRVEGETWRADACTRCVCQGGRALCEARQCPPAPCAAPAPPRPGACCAECPPAPAPSSSPRRACGRRAHGAAWREARACRSCVCVDGEAHCFADRCPPTPCARPVLPKNRCCPVCLLDEGISKHCVSGNITYLEGEEWLNDQCTRCVCRDGQNVCAPRKCPVLCPNPVNVPDQCCPICPDQAEFTTSAWLEEWKYLLIIGVFLVIFMILLAYICYQCYLNRQPKLDVSPKSCPNPAYNGYTHRNSFPPPRYTSTDRQSKCEAYHYKYVPSYDSQQFDSLKSPSFGASEKTALAPV
ncbi:Putative cysteine-rich protein 11, partial [Gryllus bimaculatus]